MLKNRLAALLFVTNLFFGVLSPQALAASLTAGYSVSPNKTVLTASAGESKPINITLANLHKDMSIKIGINYFNYTPKEDGSPNVDKSALALQVLPVG